jgi:putative effector of murein hydrolase LrgA (UPF0299 family)
VARMTENELTWEERDHLYKLSAIPFLIVLYAFIAYLFYLMQTDLLKTTLDTIILLGLPFSIIGPTTLFLTFEALYYRRIRKTAAFHIRRLVRRLLFVNAGVLSLWAIVIIFDVVLSANLGEKNATRLGFGIAAIALLIVVLKFTKRRFRKVFEQA